MRVISGEWTSDEFTLEEENSGQWTTDYGLSVPMNANPDHKGRVIS